MFNFAGSPVSLMKSIEWKPNFFLFLYLNGQSMFLLGVPGCPHVFLEFLYRVRATGLLCELPPTVVHCSAGIGRSGAFVIADAILAMVFDLLKTKI